MEIYGEINIRRDIIIKPMGDCSKCQRVFERHVERKSFHPLRKKYSQHIHYGIPFYRYGVCSKNHFTRLERTFIEWSPCIICLKRNKSLKKKRKYLAAKKRKEEKNLPSFLRDTLEEFERRKKAGAYDLPTDKKDGSYADVYDRPIPKDLRGDLREDIRREVTEELKESIRHDVIRDIKKDLCIKIYNSMKGMMKRHVQKKVDEVISFDDSYFTDQSLSQPSSPRHLKSILKNSQSQPNSPTFQLAQSNLISPTNTPE